MAEPSRVVTLDGPAGVGKTTLAKALAQDLNAVYLDTGAMFRAVAWRLGPGSWDLPETELTSRLQGLRFGLCGRGAASSLTLDGEALPQDIRTETVGMWASNLATLSVVREFLKIAQRELVGETLLVAEGRDMGTVIFPTAAYKFFLDADPEERARRRQLQLQEMGVPADYDELVASIRRRDAQDRGRAIAPLAPAPDAVLVDTTHLTPSQVLATLLETIRATEERS